MARNDKEKNIKITKIVFGFIQLVINLFQSKHGKIPETPAEVRDSIQELKNSEE